MSNSATSAAKRRRAAPFLSSPALQPNLSQDNSKVINNAAPQLNQLPEQKMLTLQQVIALVDSRLTNLEKNVIEMKSQPQTASTDATHAYMDKNSFKPEVEAILFEYLSEFDERYEILANEITELKNIVLGLQSYTLNVNKVLMEERLKTVTESASTEESDIANAQSQDDVVLVESHSQTEEHVSSEEDVIDTPTEILDETATLEESVKSIDNQPEIAVVSKSQKKKGSNKKSQITLDQEY